MNAFFSTMLLLCLLGGPLGLAQQAGPAPNRLPTNAPRTQSPRILADNRVEFQIRAPQAQKVQLDLGRLYNIFQYNDFPGSHEWQVWRKSLHDFAQRLFKE